MEHLSFFVLGVADYVGEVGSCEAHGEEVWGGEFELLHYVLRYFGGGCGG